MTTNPPAAEVEKALARADYRKLVISTGLNSGTQDERDLVTLAAALRAEQQKCAGLEAGDDATYELGKRDGYESAVQDFDLATGGDGEFKGSTIPGETVDVPAMKARVLERLTASEARADAAEKEREDWRQRYFTARDALHPLTYPPDPVTLRAIADEIDCNPGCERGYTEHDTNAFVCSAEDRGECGWAKAEELRAFATAIETRAALAPAPGEAG